MIKDGENRMWVIGSLIKVCAYVHSSYLTPQEMLILVKRLKITFFKIQDPYPLSSKKIYTFPNRRSLPTFPGRTFPDKRSLTIFPNGRSFHTFHDRRSLPIFPNKNPYPLSSTEDPYPLSWFLSWLVDLFFYSLSTLLI